VTGRRFFAFSIAANTLTTAFLDIGTHSTVVNEDAFGNGLEEIGLFLLY
jgi:hypothetical protein